MLALVFEQADLNLRAWLTDRGQYARQNTAAVGAGTAAWMCARDVIAGISHFHGLNLIHRDLKPDNVLLCHSPTGQAVL